MPVWVAGAVHSFERHFVFLRLNVLCHWRVLHGVVRAVPGQSTASPWLLQEA